MNEWKKYKILKLHIHASKAFKRIYIFVKFKADRLTIHTSSLGLSYNTCTSRTATFKNGRNIMPQLTGDSARYIYDAIKKGERSFRNGGFRGLTLIARFLSFRGRCVSNWAELFPLNGNLQSSRPLGNSFAAPGGSHFAAGFRLGRTASGSHPKPKGGFSDSVSSRTSQTSSLHIAVLDPKFLTLDLIITDLSQLTSEFNHPPGSFKVRKSHFSMYFEERYTTSLVKQFQLQNQNTGHVTWTRSCGVAGIFSDCRRAHEHM